MKGIVHELEFPPQCHTAAMVEMPEIGASEFATTETRNKSSLQMHTQVLVGEEAAKAASEPSDRTIPPPGCTISYN